MVSLGMGAIGRIHSTLNQENPNQIILSNHHKDIEMQGLSLNKHLEKTQIKVEKKQHMGLEFVRHLENEPYISKSMISCNFNIKVDPPKNFILT